MIIKEMEKKLNSNILYLYNNISMQDDAIIDSNMVGEISKHIVNMKRYPKITLVLNTRGGNLASGYRIIKLFRKYFEEIDAIVLGNCGSTGTFVLLAADNIYAADSALITPTEPQMDLLDGTDQNVSISLIRNFLESYCEKENSVKKLDAITFGNYCTTISYFKDLCYNAYGDAKAERIFEYMTKKVNSHQYPLQKDDFERMGLELLDIPDFMYSFFFNEHQIIVDFLRCSKTFDKKYTMIRSADKISVYIKKYDQKKYKIDEGYFEMEENIMHKVNAKNARVADIMEEEKTSENATYRDAYSDRHWDSYNDSYYHDSYDDHYKDYGDNSYYHDSYRDGIQTDVPRVKQKSKQNKSL